MKYYLILILIFAPFLSQADLQSDFFEALNLNQQQKTVEPQKVQRAIQMIEKKLGLKSEATQIVPANPFAIAVGGGKSVAHIHQLIYLKFKDEKICRAQLETYQDQPLYNGLKVICLQKSNVVNNFQETL